MFLKSLLTTGLLTTVAATVGSLATDDVPRSRWYKRLRKPSYQPPPAAFPVVWTTLYADIALTSAAVISRRSTRTSGAAPSRARGYLPALIINLILNAGWSIVFFRMRNLPLSAVVAVALAASSTDLAARAGRVRPALGWALSPYAAWCTFAAVLSNHIRVLNK